jgi:hypothetical protein
MYTLKVVCGVDPPSVQGQYQCSSYGHGHQRDLRRSKVIHQLLHQYAVPPEPAIGSDALINRY